MHPFAPVQRVFAADPLSEKETAMNVQFQPNFRMAERRLPFECVALVLQGGGALGAYQAGVYEALAEAHVDPDRVAGVSIGAIQFSGPLEGQKTRAETCGTRGS
jgi:Patatin-like phospholipase